MAVTYDVCALPDDHGGYQKGSQRDSIQTTWGITYQVIVSDPADPEAFDPTTISVFDVMARPEIPKVNQTTYLTPDGRVIPYLLCRDKKCSRDGTAWGKFLVQTQWDTGDRADQTESGTNPQTPPVDITGYAPKVETTLGEQEIIRASDKDLKQCLTPTGNQYDRDFVELLPTEQRRVTQYETFISYNDMKARKFKTNSVIYRTEPIRSWFMLDVEATEVQVELAGGPTTVAQVTYTMSLTERPGLWNDERALIDTHYFDETNNDKKTAFLDQKLQRFTVGNVDLQGRAQAPGQAMEYDDWRMQDEIDFNSFLLI